MAKIYGYSRVSTQKQSLERQNKNIREKYPNAVIYADKYTGTKFSRPKWEQLMKTVKKGDTIVFDSVSRMSRDAVEGFKVYEDLFRRGVSLEFLKEPMVNTEVYRKQITDARSRTIQLDASSGNRAVDNFTSGLMELVNRLFMDMAAEQIRIAFEQSEKEVHDIHGRISEGVQLAIANGKPVGGLNTKGKKLTTQKSVESKETIRQHCKDFGGSLSDTECMKLCGISRNSYYKYKRELREAGATA